MEEVSLKAQRSALIDRLRGIGILLVVLGHSLQFANGDRYGSAGLFFDSKLFAFIYGMHMPLLAALSGYLFYGSLLRKRQFDIAKSLVFSLLLPIAAWSVIDYAYEQIFTDGGAIELFSRQTARRFVMNFWFLWSIFFLSIASILMYRAKRFSLIMFFALLLLSFITVDKWNFELHKFLFPFFAVPALWRNSRTFELACGFLRSKAIFCGVSLMILYLVLVLVWKREFYIYVSGFSLVGKILPMQINFDLIRWFAGAVGVVAVVAVNLAVPVRIGSWLCVLGRHSLGIYVVSGMFFMYSIPSFFSGSDFSLIRTILVTILVLVVSLLISAVVKSSRYLNFVFMGGRR